MSTSRKQIRIWRGRAAEYLAAAESATNSATRETYLNLARSYERLAELSDEVSQREGGPEDRD